MWSPVISNRTSPISCLGSRTGRSRRFLSPLGQSIWPETLSAATRTEISGSLVPASTPPAGAPALALEADRTRLRSLCHWGASLGTADLKDPFSDPQSPSTAEISDIRLSAVAGFRSHPALAVASAGLFNRPFDKVHGAAP